MRPGNVLALLVALGAVGCGVSMGNIHALAVTVPVGQPSVLDDLEGVARSRGYTILDPDPAAGSFAVEAERRARPTETIRFTVQCYRDGFATVVPSGPRVERRGDDYHLPSGARDEYLALVIAIRDAVHRSAP